MKRATLVLAIASAAAVLSGCASVNFYAHYIPYYLSGPGPSGECGEGPDFKYCLYSAPKGVQDDPDSVLYFLHYADGSERSWGKIPIARVYYSEFRSRGLPAPRVATVSYGPYWTLFDKPGPKSPARFAPFTEKVMPFIEEKLGRPKRRYVWGMSQGGNNAALLVLKRKDLWSGAVFSCPAFYTFPIFGGPKVFADYVARTHANAETAAWGRGLVADRIAGPEEWAKEDPLARAAEASGLPPIYINCTKEDAFGFFEGASRMAQILRERGQSVVFKEESGAHCQLDARSISGFLADLISGSLPSAAPSRTLRDRSGD